MTYRHGATKKNIFLWVSRDFGVIELRGPTWKMAWPYPKKAGDRMQRVGLPPRLAVAMETLCAALHRSGYYLRSVELHHNQAADRINALMEKVKGKDWTKLEVPDEPKRP